MGHLNRLAFGNICGVQFTETTRRWEEKRGALSLHLDWKLDKRGQFLESRHPKDPQSPPTWPLKQDYNFGSRLCPTPSLPTVATTVEVTAVALLRLARGADSLTQNSTGHQFSSGELVGWDSHRLLLEATFGLARDPHRPSPALAPAWSCSGSYASSALTLRFFLSGSRLVGVKG